jgi:serine/threonine protein kinase
LHEEKGVVHRDIKPENLLFEAIPIVPSKQFKQRPYDEEKEDEGEFIPNVGGGGIGQVKIADFGLSKIVWQDQTATPCGTVGYTAPEIVKDERYSKSVDMWAMGCVLYTLLCGCQSPNSLSLSLKNPSSTRTNTESPQKIDMFPFFFLPSPPLLRRVHPGLDGKSRPRVLHLLVPVVGRYQRLV